VARCSSAREPRPNWFCAAASGSPWPGPPPRQRSPWALRRAWTCCWSGAAHTAETRGEGPQIFQLFPDTAEQARACSGPHRLEGFEYYISGPTAHPRSAKFLTWSSIDHMAFFDAFRFVNLIGQRPLLMIVGREGVTAWISIQAVQNATGPRELHGIDGASHDDLYYKEQYVGPAITKLAGFFTSNLAAVDTTPAQAASA
jgi:fermentation-respiration switch protein FrsA (DUF1100 family)